MSLCSTIKCKNREKDREHKGQHTKRQYLKPKSFPQRHTPRDNSDFQEKKEGLRQNVPKYVKQIYLLH